MHVYWIEKVYSPFCVVYFSISIIVAFKPSLLVYRWRRASSICILILFIFSNNERRRRRNLLSTTFVKLFPFFSVQKVTLFYALMFVMLVKNIFGPTNKPLHNNKTNSKSMSCCVWRRMNKWSFVWWTRRRRWGWRGKSFFMFTLFFFIWIIKRVT